MESCNCSSDCISKTTVPMTNLRLIITTIFIKYSSLLDNEMCISRCTIEVAKGVTEDRFMELKLQWLKARYFAISLRSLFYDIIKYVDNCKVAQSLLLECIKLPKFREYSVVRKKLSKTIDKFLSIGLTTKDWEQIVEAKRQQALTFRDEYMAFIDEKKKRLAESIQQDKELIRLRRVKN